MQNVVTYTKPVLALLSYSIATQISRQTVKVAKLYEALRKRLARKDPAESKCIFGAVRSLTKRRWSVRNRRREII